MLECSTTISNESIRSRGFTQINGDNRSAFICVHPPLKTTSSSDRHDHPAPVELWSSPVVGDRVKVNVPRPPLHQTAPSHFVSRSVYPYRYQLTHDDFLLTSLTSIVLPMKCRFPVQP